MTRTTIGIPLTIRPHLVVYHPQRESPGDPQRRERGEMDKLCVQFHTIAACAWQSCVAQIDCCTAKVPR